ncbi:DNA-binding PadR family transcriptional regulator [Bacillus pakistanensis]|uniref:DNA-binding PadR family transcriptional regulator n=1 Tax=Rossellomorea pakistanensis TaxID=992288 RepID=A0ABS2N776_9BACI|nr:DNA-binding PadR family transcriptional regulator [Bacillus pakistanensis]
MTKLKDQEWVNTYREMTESGKVRVYYKINEKGKRFLEKKIVEWLELQNDIKSLLETNQKGE